MIVVQNVPRYNHHKLHRHTLDNLPAHNLRMYLVHTGHKYLPHCTTDKIFFITLRTCFYIVFVQDLVLVTSKNFDTFRLPGFSADSVPAEPFDLCCDWIPNLVVTVEFRCDRIVAGNAKWNMVVEFFKQPIIPFMRYQMVNNSGFLAAGVTFVIDGEKPRTVSFPFFVIHRIDPGSPVERTACISTVSWNIRSLAHGFFPLYIGSSIY